MDEPAATPAARLSRIIALLAQKLSSLGASYPGGLLDHVRIALILSRILPIAHRVEAIARHLARGTLRRPPTRNPRPTPAKPRPPLLRWPLRLKCGHGWLSRMDPVQLGPYGTYLATLLREPDMQALIAAAPQIRRILRPLCRMLAVTVLKEPPYATPAPPRPRPAPRPSPRAASPARWSPCIAVARPQPKIA